MLSGAVHRALQPLPGVEESPLAGDVVHDDDGVRLAEVLLSDGAVTLLPRRVPALQTDALAVGQQRARVEIHSHRGLEVACKLARAEASNQRRLADVRIANKNNLRM